nr:hypothetical protein [Nocardioides albidus]
MSKNAPNACCQLDATEYVLTGDRKCVIFQPIDDHSRYAVGSHVADGETSEAATVKVDGRYAFQHVSVIVDSDHITATDLERELLIEHQRAPAGIRYVGNGRPPGGRGPGEVSGKS